jgi:hypothetical protein
VHARTIHERKSTGWRTHENWTAQSP